MASAADDTWYWQKPGSILVQHIATIIMCITLTHCLVSFTQIVYVSVKANLLMCKEEMMSADPCE